jgi:histidine ammonia-lyase
MIAQYTAASLVNECRTLGRAATDNTPVSGGQEDHVSMSAQAAMHARTAVERATTVVGCELLCATEALRYVDDGLSPGAGTGAAADLVGETVPALAPAAGGESAGDRPLHRELDRVGELVVSGAVHDRVGRALAEPLE